MSTMAVMVASFEKPDLSGWRASTARLGSGKGRVTNAA
jgi:hypothetical protein